ncbi:cysteine hydrolase [Ktedonosporobacter rubrisoli]|uniref:Cysteine hydrolase n=1 Tax=Ktedonosporobacter rubrisoli TaxID=2509675 RepID=A0A4P6JII5_KTERU|nr:cysteine hydrolase family protein [Ktedonosporobacter rubrisoli]QBD74710.1 cysteine hydrolase [Ktedonosporobacter rubrisoli]
MNTAILVIDVQNGMFAEDDPVYQDQEILSKIASLLEKARKAQIPIIYIQHGSPNHGHPLEIGTDGWQIHPAIAPREGEVVIQKRMPDSFYGTNLHEVLSAHEIKHLIVTGIQTDCCVDTTCRRASSLEYDVTLVQDAHSTWDNEILSAAQIIAHHNTILDGWFVTLKTADSISFSRTPSGAI